MAISQQNFESQAWNRATIFPTSNGTEVQAAFDRLDNDLGLFEAYESVLNAPLDQTVFRTILLAYESIIEQLKTLEGYVELWLAEDSQNQEAHAFDARVRQYTSDVAERTRFFITWWQNLQNDTAVVLMNTIPTYRHWLHHQRALIPYTRSPEIEQILQMNKQTHESTYTALFQTIKSRYHFPIVINGERHELTSGMLTDYVMGSDPQIRWDTWESVFQVYCHDRLIIGNVYRALAQSWWNEHVTVRGFTTPIAARNLTNDIPDTVVETLLTVCRQNAPLFHRYFQLKAPWLGVESMRPSDVFAQVGHSPTYNLPTTIRLVIDAFNRFDSSLGTMIETLFTEDHIDTEDRLGKRSGAWNFTQTPKIMPWISLSFTEHINAVFELAHECGHAVHAMLASQQTMLNYPISIPLSETASIFAEMLLFEYLFEYETDPLVQQSLRFRQLDDASVLLQRPVFATFFEQQAYAIINEGASIDDVAKLYLSIMHEEFGPHVEIPEMMQWEWLMKSEFYYDPFYSYSYAFGYLLAMALYQRYKTEGAAFVPTYLRILAAGGADSPITILAEAGIDINDPAFWQAGFDRLQLMLDAIEVLPLPTASK